MIGIKGFKMPNTCGECQMASCAGLSGHFYCDITTYDVDMDDTERDADCPLVEAIPKADYENRLKADMIAMLEELKEQLREMHEDFFETEHFDEAYGVSDSMDVIQERINDLVGKDGNIREERQNEKSN